MTTAEIEIDERGRVSLGRLGLSPGRYRVNATKTSATFERVTSYTETELLALQDSKIAAVHRTFAEGELKTVVPDDLP